MNKLFSYIYTHFHTRVFLQDMLVRYSAQNHALEDENERLRKKLGQKDKVLQRALDDHAQSNKFHQAVITGMQKQISNDKPYTTLKFALASGEVVEAELYVSKERSAIDLSLTNGYQDVFKIASLEYEHPDAQYVSRPGILVLRTYDMRYDNAVDVLKEIEIPEPKELDPETEQDYIDQIIERQVEEHDAAQAQKG